MHALARLPFRLPDFTRISWTSDRARARWEPRVRRISIAWSEVEWLAVAAGVRRCCLTRMSPARFVASTPRWAARTVSALGLAQEAASRWTYSSNATQRTPGAPYLLSVGLGRLADLDLLKAAFEAHDDDAIGALLGYPECCRRFFHEVWVQDGLVDTTWPMAVDSVESGQGSTCVDASGPFAANILWRWMGVRAVPHLPCSFACAATVSLGERLRGVGIASGYREEMDWIEEILSWPVEWSALHGIAEIKTPVLKVATRTDATSVKYVVRRSGTRYPDEGATALRFPYRERGPEQPSPSPLKPRYDRLAWYYRDNGFASREAMDRAHDPIVALAATALGSGGGSVLDLGCGNGVLLGKIGDRTGGRVVPFGIDVEATRIAHARRLLPGFASNFRVGSLFEDEALWDRGFEYHLVLLAIRRLVEVPPEVATRLKRRLSDQRLLVYVYPEAHESSAHLDALAARAGLRLTVVGEAGRVALAEIRP